MTTDEKIAAYREIEKRTSALEVSMAKLRRMIERVVNDRAEIMGMLDDLGRVVPERGPGDSEPF